MDKGLQEAQRTLRQFLNSPDWGKWEEVKEAYCDAYAPDSKKYRRTTYLQPYFCGEGNCPLLEVRIRKGDVPNGDFAKYAGKCVCEIGHVLDGSHLSMRGEATVSRLIAEAVKPKRKKVFK